MLPLQQINFMYIRFLVILTNKLCFFVSAIQQQLTILDLAAFKLIHPDVSCILQTSEDICNDNVRYYNVIMPEQNFTRPTFNY